MKRIRVAQLPFIVQAAVAVVLLAGWVWFENHLIEPLGIWRFMPFYRYGRFCPWDFLAAMVIIASFVTATFKQRRVPPGQ